MNLSDKLFSLRKKQGLSQEALAEKLNVSRQAVSRWENSSAQPDASNILQLSKLFDVTADYLLNDDYHSDDDSPKVQTVKQNNLRLIMLYLVLIEVMTVLMQFLNTIILKNIFFAVLSLIPFAAIIGGFEYAYRKNRTEVSKNFRRTFYKLSAWLGLYFPIRFLLTIVMEIFPQLFSPVVFEIVTLGIYIMSAMLIMLSLDKKALEQPNR